MKSTSKYLREDLLKLSPYKPAKEPCQIKLNSNESPYDLPEDLKMRIWERVKKESFNCYYDPSCDEVRQALAGYLGIEPDKIFVGSGADEIIYDIVLAFAGPGREVIIPVPAFPSYETFSIISGARVINIPLLLEKYATGWKWSLDVLKIKKYFKKDTPQVMFICYPNNPTGDYFEEEDIIELIDGFNGIVAIDEAYYEFGGRTFINRLSDYPNLVIIRTFSKVFSLAGLRIGYAVANEALIEEFYKVKPPYNVSLFSQIAAVEVLKNMDWVEKVRRKIISARENLKTKLEGIPGITVYPSSANFFLCRFEISRDYVYQKLLEKGILTKKPEGEGVENTLRFSVGTPKQNEVLIRSLKEILKGS
ncbi:histidinol-phosphate transaminase [Thermosediminibacter oceani]|uniref:Histidinol-phosphate aminotransferase n=1 Tax=Thermosediminibacter oceani (strain ATCC BAA-1034 / DSM 16646 / JW/IW-1228P) TaxID=555079 RepID=D9RXU5_THEOJ|nr:histidinol-phosphate transaminase [Thermosediminibacter oceani]ADL08169.1 histidinol-phosphate aminotransferase [Thermosediminibacter oceani DSM 16646]